MKEEPIEYGLWKQKEGYSFCSDTIYQKGNELIRVVDLMQKYNEYLNKTK